MGDRDDLDKYFHNLRHSPDKAEKPAQLLSPRLAEIIKTLEVQEKPGGEKQQVICWIWMAGLAKTLT